MKVAFWALGMLVFSLFGIVLINLFGNITVTNQLNYTTLKNAVDASMNDSIDQAYFDAGFCICTDRAMTSGKWVFNDSSEYELADIRYVDGKETCSSTKKYCKMLFGEYRINKKTFSESVVRRFAEMVNNNKSYRIVIQDVNEYPPKVSVRVLSHDTEFSPTENDPNGYDIVNQIDAIIETHGVQILDQPTSNNKKNLVCATPTPQPTATPKLETYKCAVRFYDHDKSNCAGYTSDIGCCNAKCKDIYSRYPNDAVSYRCFQAGVAAACEIEWKSRDNAKECAYEPDPTPTPKQSEPTPYVPQATQKPGDDGEGNWHPPVSLDR